MDTIYFIDYCLFIVSEFLLLNAPFVFYHFNHVLYEVCCFASHEFYVLFIIHALSEMAK